jgi:Zn-dependent metalloprotease
MARNSRSPAADSLCMRKVPGHLRYLGLPLLGACAALAACSSSPEPTDATAPDLAAQLEKDTGTPWTVYVDPRSHEVRFLAPNTPVQLPGGSLEDKARAFFTQYKATLHATGRSDEIKIVSTRTDRGGGTHIRFDHYLAGTTLPVFGAGSTAHFTPDGAVYWLETDFRADLADVSATSTVSKDAATAAALAYVKASCGVIRGESTTTPADLELGIFADPESKAALAYRVLVSAQSAGCVAPAVFVDAKSGVALGMLERAHSAASPQANGSRFYRAGGDATDHKSIDIQPIGTSAAPLFSMTSDSEVPGQRTITFAFNNTVRPITTTDPKSWDESSSAPGAAVDAQFNVRNVLPFLRGFEGPHDAHGKPDRFPLGFDVHVIVHDNTSNKGGNAKADFERFGGATFERDTIRFGDGNFPTVANELPWSAAYDVAAHEVTHLITTHTSMLEYRNESGALNESFSDAMAAAAEHKLVPNDAKNFTIGEDLYLSARPGPKALRSMTAPRSVVDVDGHGDPDHREDQKGCNGAAPSEKNDYCGVHSNSGIPNRAFSLIVNGGLLGKFSPGKAPEPRPIGVPSGIGWDQAAEVTYWATTGLNSTATFENAALAQIAEVGRSLDATKVRIVSCAWYAVGVFVPRTDVERTLLDVFCKPPAPPSPPPPPGPSGIVGSNVCAGHGDALVCDPAAPAQAIVCRNGAPAVPPATAFCADPTQTCKRTSASDPTAVMQDGAIVCE